MAIALQAQSIEVRAVRYPACVCGAAFGQHVTPTCSGYAPRTPIEDLGTRSFTPSGLWPWRVRVLSLWYWRIEAWAKVRRERLVAPK